MIVTEILGGFGNQLFQYAHGFALAKKLNCSLALDARQFKTYNLRKFDLDLFKTNATIIHTRNSLKFRKNDSIFLINPRIGIRKLSVFQEKSLAFDPIQVTQKHIFLQGYWQSEKYFNEFATDLRSIFTEPSALQTPAFLKWKNLIKSTPNSVSVHIRRGDYVNNPETRKVHFVCDVPYYQNAITFLKGKLSNPTFFFFSDDIEWVKQNLHLPNNAHYVSSPELNALSEFFLMKNCENSIISNSTFSWWATWLRSQEGLVAAPDRWFNIEEMNCIDIVPDRWTKIQL